MGSVINDIPTLNAAFKVQYADQMQKLVPEMTPIMSKVPFVPANQKAGSVFVQPALLSLDQGFTCLGPADNVMNLNNPVQAQIQQAQVGSCAYMGRTWISYTALSRATGGSQAFIDATSYSVESLSKSFSHMNEAQLWYGQSGLATVVGATLALSAKTLVIEPGASAAFLFIGGEGMPIDIYTAAGVLTLSTTIKQVRIGETVSAGPVFVDADKTSLVLDSVTGLSDGVTYVIYRKGYKGLEAPGLKTILTTNNIFGIDGDNYGLWRSNRYAASGALSFSVLSAAVAKSIGRGLTGPLMGWVNPRAFRSLMPDYVSIGDGANTNPKSRRFDNKEDVKNLVHGVKTMNFIVDSVDVELGSTEFVKGADAFLLSKEDMVRVGSTPMTFTLPGLQSGEYFLPRPDQNAAEIRIFSDFSIFAEALNKNLIITSITV